MPKDFLLPWPGLIHHHPVVTTATTSSASAIKSSTSPFEDRLTLKIKKVRTILQHNWPGCVKSDSIKKTKND